MDDPILTIEEREAINSGRWFSPLSTSLRHDILRCAYVKRCKAGELIAGRIHPPPYCERTGLATVQSLKADRNFYMAYNMFRIAAILQGIAKRVEAGTASSAQAATSGACARPMAALTWQFVEQA